MDATKIILSIMLIIVSVTLIITNASYREQNNNYTKCIIETINQEAEKEYCESNLITSGDKLLRKAYEYCYIAVTNGTQPNMANLELMSYSMINYYNESNGYMLGALGEPNWNYYLLCWS